MPEFVVNRSKDPALKCITFLSHGTLESRYSWMFSQGGDLQSWGAGKDDKVNPNAYKGRGGK